MTRPSTRLQRVLWTITACERERYSGDDPRDPVIELYASRDVTSAALEMRGEPWVNHDVTWAMEDPALREITYHAARPHIDIEMREYVVLRGPNLRTVLEALYRRWASRPDGDVSPG